MRSLRCFSVVCGAVINSQRVVPQPPVPRNGESHHHHHSFNHNSSLSLPQSHSPPLRNGSGGISKSKAGQARKKGSDSHQSWTEDERQVLAELVQDIQPEDDDAWAVRATACVSMPGGLA